MPMQPWETTRGTIHGAQTHKLASVHLGQRWTKAQEGPPPITGRGPLRWGFTGGGAGNRTPGLNSAIVLPRASCCAYRCQRMVGDDVSRGVPAPDCGRNVDRA